jgi:fatty-acyl-CoA synthase
VLSLIDRIENVAENHDRPVTFISGDVEDQISWSVLHHDARLAAAKLQARGVKPGDHVALLGPTTRNFVTAIQATWLTGATLVTMPLPMRMGALDVFIEQTRNRIRRADVSVVVIDAELAAFVEPVEGDPPFVSLDEICAQDGVDLCDYTRPKSDPNTLAVLQFTSGSTSEPKGVMLPHENVCHNLDASWEAAEMSHDDVIVSWLPLYHDMGLIGLLTIPMSLGSGLAIGAPQDFLARPLRWMRWMSNLGGTGTAGPNFAYALAARALARCEEQLDLSGMRILLNGAEPVDPNTFRKFLEAGERFGLDPNAAYPAYGMAEVCIGGSFPVPGKGLRTDWVDKRSLEIDGVAKPADPESEGAAEYVILGSPVPGLEMRIVHPETREVLGDRLVGELQISGTSLTRGYYKNPEATDALIVDGWLNTGDLTYTIGGEIVVCGRSKDVMIVGGRNIYPQDIEKAAGEVEGIRTGNVIAFGVEGRQGAQNIIVVVESKGGNLEEIRRNVITAVTRAEGVPPKEVVLVDPGTVPKTSSGKLQRAACKLSYGAGELSRL